MDAVLHGDCLDELKKLADDSIDLVCTDPPYGYSFMGKDWDKAVPSVDVWNKCLRVLKPGGFAFVMSAPRQDVLSQMIVRIGEAGFDTDFTSIYWTYASGFPKAANIGKMVDKRKGTPRACIAGGAGTKRNAFPLKSEDQSPGARSPEAQSLRGSYGGFQPKPAVEVIIVAMKPLSEKTFVDQALKNGKGVTWLDDARIPIGEDNSLVSKNPHTKRENSRKYTEIYGEYQGSEYELPKGRFAANLLISDQAVNDNDYSRYFSLDEWAGRLPDRVKECFPFLIAPKASKREKNGGLGNLPVRQSTGGGGPSSAHGSIKAPGPNYHPTVKPLQLMCYLITLGSRPGDVVLDPFLGSGTTALAAKLLRRHYIGVEKEADYVEIGEARLQGVTPFY